MMVMKFTNIDSGDPWPSPIIFHDPGKITVLDFRDRLSKTDP
jgi:hypothetical protein